MRLLITVLAGLLLLGASLAPASAASKKQDPEGREPLCESNRSLCGDPFKTLGIYVGHDEPSVEFKSASPGSGNDITYRLTLPKDPPQHVRRRTARAAPGTSSSGRPSGSGSRCATRSRRPSTRRPARPTQTRTTSSEPNPTAAGLHRQAPRQRVHGAAVLRPRLRSAVRGLRLHGAPVLRRHDDRQPDRPGPEHRRRPNNADCDNYILGGIEPINWAYITKSGVSQAPANPLFTGTFDDPNFAAVNPDSTEGPVDEPGRPHQDPHARHGRRVPGRPDRPARRVRAGSMTASIANGFGHILYEPELRHMPCGAVRVPPRVQHGQPARQHVVRAHLQRGLSRTRSGTSRTASSWTRDFNCAVPAGYEGQAARPDDDNDFCVPAEDSMLVQINGCFSDDGDFDGPVLSARLAGDDPNRAAGRRAPPIAGPVHQPARERRRRTTRRSRSRPTCPRIEAADSQDNPPFCNRTTGADCVNPPRGAAFYPFYSTRMDERHLHLAGGRRFHPRHHQRLRRQLDHASMGRCCSRSIRPSASRPSAATTTSRTTCT